MGWVLPPPPEGVAASGKGIRKEPSPENTIVEKIKKKKKKNRKKEEEQRIIPSISLEVAGEIIKKHPKALEILKIQTRKRTKVKSQNEEKDPFYRGVEGQKWEYFGDFEGKNE